jgi:uncharacterized membrane protein
VEGRSYFGDAMILLFLFVQLFDGACTYLGIQHFGSDIERNPIVAWYIATVGTVAGLIAVKTFAASCAMFLHLRGWHRTIGVLTILYLLAAVRPWTDILLAVSL